MGLETVTYISDFDVDNPVNASDLIGFGDDHIRRLKDGLKNTFPNISGAVTATHTELNLADGLTASTAELNVIDGVTATAAELEYCKGLTSAVQTQIATKEGKFTFSTKSADFTCAAGFWYVIDTNGVQATLPASATQGDTIRVSNSTAIAKTVRRNGHNIMGAASDASVAALRTTKFLYYDTTTGWIKHAG